MNTRTILILGVLAIGLGIVWYLMSGVTEKNSENKAELETGVMGDPVDLAFDFYDAWLEAKQSAETDPYTAGLAADPVLGAAVQEQLQAKEDDERDPVLCQTDIPTSVRLKSIFENDDAVQFMVSAKDEGMFGQAVVTINAAQDEGFWYVSDISCSNGEQAPEQGEYSFERRGLLLKYNVPEPLNPEYWHLVFEQDGVDGYTAPLFMDDQAVCVREDKIEVACSDEVLYETMSVQVKGEMTEAGVEVKRIESLE